MIVLLPFLQYFSLQQACGFKYTSKLRTMLQDIRTSETLTLEYKKYYEDNPVTDIGMRDFDTIIINKKYWISFRQFLYNGS